MLIGITRMLNIKLTWRGSTRVPIVSPSDRRAGTRAGSTVTSTSQCTSQVTGVLGTSNTIGSVIAAAIAAWIAPDTIFCIATAHTGSGAITRSSISRV